MNTLDKVSRDPIDKQNALNQFLDDFYRSASREQQAMLSAEPTSDVDPIFAANLAATAELLSHRFGLETPSWTCKPKYYLDEPSWGLPELCKTSERAREYLIETTCPEFGKENSITVTTFLRGVDDG